jgi:predicted N-acyltransferase
MLKYTEIQVNSLSYALWEDHMPDLVYKIYGSIDAIGRQEWDVLFDDIPESYLFYKTLEHSNLEGFVFYYLAVYRGEETVLIAPLFCRDFNLDIAVEGPLAKIIASARRIIPRLLVMKTLFCGSPFAEYGVLGVKGNSRPGHDVLGCFLAGLEELARRERSVLILFKDFPQSGTLFLDWLKGLGFIRVHSFPAVCVDTAFSSFEGYLKSLGRSTRKNLTRKLRQAHSLGNIEIREARDVRGQIDQVVRLYEDTYKMGTTKFEHLSREFFLRVSDELREQARFFLYYIDGTLAAFNLCFVYKDLLIDKFIGFNYDISKRYNLYFVSWAYNIKWCIENSVRHYYPGQTDYEPKIRLGGRIVPLYAYLRHNNPVLNFLFRALAVALKPDNFYARIRG